MGFDNSRVSSAAAMHIGGAKRANINEDALIYPASRLTPAPAAGISSVAVGGPARSPEAVESGHNSPPGLEDGDRIAIIESRTFLRECIRRGMQPAFPIALDTYASTSELEDDERLPSTRLAIVSWTSDDQGRSESTVIALSKLIPGAPIIVLAHRMDPEMARHAMAAGAKGYIPMSMGFDLAVEVVRFTLAGGTYVPPEYFLAGAGTLSATVRAEDPSAMTPREMLVVRAIQQGKPNKIIAYELNLCESTVKVHVRHIMKKLGVKNRTAVAMKAHDVLTLSRARDADG